MLGLPWSSTIFLIIIPIIQVVFSIWYYVRNKFEGQDMEEKYEVDDWFWTF